MGGTMFRSRIIALAAVGVLAAAQACDLTAPRPGKISLKLTDAPGDVSVAVVTIEQIYLQPAGDDSSHRIILRDEPVTVDLLTLAGTTMDLVTNAAIPGGAYGQLRFVVSGAYIEVERQGSDDVF